MKNDSLSQLYERATLACSQKKKFPRLPATLISTTAPLLGMSGERPNKRPPHLSLPEPKPMKKRVIADNDPRAIMAESIAALRKVHQPLLEKDVSPPSPAPTELSEAVNNLEAIAKNKSVVEVKGLEEVVIEISDSDENTTGGRQAVVLAQIPSMQEVEKCCESLDDTRFELEPWNTHREVKKNSVEKKDVSTMLQPASPSSVLSPEFESEEDSSMWETFRTMNQESYKTSPSPPTLPSTQNSMKTRRSKAKSSSRMQKMKKDFDIQSLLKPVIQRKK